ncbi:MAG: putative serine/threonine protein kinase, partial [Cyanobacteria bacterium RYN_339]|nr:putative serine/threonine protein kinase [Cyanobacteria bacterium RYN_339]
MIADRYELKELLGRGAMGEVRRAFDHVTGHDVALALAPESDPLRFQERGRALVRLRHPGLVPVLDHGMADAHTGYLVMAIVPGHLHAHGPVPAEEACRILAGLARALAVLHARGYVHRDVKAANVRITPDGSPVLLDFGLVAPAGEAADGKAVTGTPAYLAPEAIAGGVITAATDLYALGCLAYELLTGHPPFAGTPAEVLRAQLHAPPPPLAAPPELVAVVAALLRKAPGDRPPDAQAVAILLEAAGDLEPGDELEGPPQLATERLVGREQELATLADALRDVLAGQGRAVIVAAPPGVGKSRLVQEAVWAARREDVEAVAARCRPDAAEPLQAVTEIWGPVEAGHDKASFHAELARRLAERAPLLVVVDDLQWGDAASLEAINACMRLLANERVLWLATLRPEEAPPGHGAWHAAEEGLATVLRLAPLTRDRADALLAALLHPADLPPSFARMVHETTGGNAFFVGETLRHLVEEGLLVRRRGQWRLARELVRVDLPEAAEAAVLRRAANLPPESAALLRLAAVLGPAPLREVLARASGLPDDAYLAAVEPLLERQFLVAGEQGYRLPHDRLREAVYGAIPAGTRRELHQRCGAALEPLDPGPAVLAHHFLRAGDAARGQRYALAAGEHYRAAGMPARALAVWQEAADLPEPP